MRRREFIALTGGAAAAWPLAARGQQRPAVIGFLHAGSPGSAASYIAEFRQTLAKAGYDENQNVKIEYRYAEGQYDRLPQLAADLIKHTVTIVVTAPNIAAAASAKAATNTIPIVFMIDDDPVKFDLVASLNRPGGNATGVNFFNNQLVAKRLGLLRELLPVAARFGALVNPDVPTAEDFIRDVTTAAAALGVKMEIVRAHDNHDIETAFATLANNKVDAVTVAADTLFFGSRVQIANLAARHAIPAIYTVRAYVENGGLMSYGPNTPETYRQLASYAARILKGDLVAELPVMQVDKFDFILNASTARALGLTFSPGLLAIADEVIE